MAEERPHGRAHERTALEVALERGLAAVGRGLYRGFAGRAIAARLARGRQVTRTRIALARGGWGLDGLRIAFLSDVHAGNYFGEADWLAGGGSRAGAGPGVPGGDLINLFGTRPTAARGLALPRAALALRGAGNHEYRADDPPSGRACSMTAGRGPVEPRPPIARGGGSLWLCGGRPAPRPSRQARARGRQ
jgi:hypothetical protein